MKYYFLALWHYADFDGRARRKEFWYYNIINIFLFIVDIIFSLKYQRIDLIIVYCIIFAIPTVSVGFRRMHDIGEKGWMFFIPFYNLLLACFEGYNKENQYGSDPKKVIVKGLSKFIKNL